jgi:glycosyltransferase involved in cell wall biosynthesis
VGRLDRGKGTEQLVESFEQLRRSQGGHLELVLIGQEVTPIKDADGVHKLGFVSLQDKWDALSACFALINASPFESLSYVLLEAWSIGKPTLCNGQCAVMVDQTRRSGCGLWYTDQYDMRAAVEVLCQNQHLSTGGPTWSSTNYGWRTITSKWKGILAY